MGSTAENEGRALAQDQQGNVYIAGIFGFTVDFDPGPGVLNLGNWNRSFIQKLDPSGNLIWVHVFGEGEEFEPTEMTFDAQNNLIVTGFFDGPVDFDPGPGVFTLNANANDNVFVLKLTADGDFIWAVHNDGFEYNRSFGVATDSASNIFIVQECNQTTDFDPGPGVYNLTGNLVDFVVQKLDSTGQFVWAKFIGGNGSDLGLDLAVDTSGNVYVTGYFSLTTDFDPGPGVFNLSTSSNGRKLFVLKLDNAGDFVWAQKIDGSPGTIEGKEISTKSSGEIVITGNFAGTFDFDPGPGNTWISSQNDFDVFVLKLDLDGNFIWAKAMMGEGFNEGEALDIDTAGNIYVGGYFADTIDFDPGPGTNIQVAKRLTDFFLVKLNPSGDLQWAVPIGSTEYDELWDLMVDSAGNVYGTGYIEWYTDFDPTSYVNQPDRFGNRDYFIMKLNQCPGMAPVPNTLALVDLTAECSIDTLIAPSATNSCGSAVAGVPTPAGPFLTQDTTNVTWTFDDGYGNTSTQSQLVIINDTTAPVPDSTQLPALSALECPITPNTPTATDNCGDTILGVSDVPFPISSGGNTTITWTFDDGAGNSSTQQQTVSFVSLDNSVTVNSGAIAANANGYTYQWVDCDNGNAPIPGATGQVLVPPGAGSYAVEINNGTCTITSDCVDFFFAGISTELSASITVYPNPTSDVVTVEISRAGSAQIELIDLLGHQLKSWNMKQQRLQIDLGDLATGGYFLKINQGEQVHMQRLQIAPR